MTVTVSNIPGSWYPTAGPEGEAPPPISMSEELGAGAGAGGGAATGGGGSTSGVATFAGPLSTVDK